MFMKIHPCLKLFPAGRALVIRLIIILAITVTTGFVWIQMDHVIAPPGLRVLDWLWRIFIVIARPVVHFVMSLVHRFFGRTPLAMEAKPSHCTQLVKIPVGTASRSSKAHGLAMEIEIGIAILMN